MDYLRPFKLAHVVYRTRRFEQMVNWHTAVFGAKVQHQSPARAFLTYGGEQWLAFLNLNFVHPDAPAIDTEGGVGVDHVAYTFESLSQLLAHYAKLKALNITPYSCLHHGITVSMYYADPDGNQLEFHTECSGTTAAAKAFMAGPGFAENPIGVAFDPDEVLARKTAGTLRDFLQKVVHYPISPTRASRGPIRID